MCRRSSTWLCNIAPSHHSPFLRQFLRALGVRPSGVGRTLLSAAFGFDLVLRLDNPNLNVKSGGQENVHPTPAPAKAWPRGLSTRLRSHPFPASPVFSGKWVVAGSYCVSPALTAKGVFFPSGKLNCPLASVRNTATVAGWLCMMDFSCGP